MLTNQIVVSDGRSDRFQLLPSVSPELLRLEYPDLVVDLDLIFYTDH